MHSHKLELGVVDFKAFRYLDFSSCFQNNAAGSCIILYTKTLNVRTIKVFLQNQGPGPLCVDRASVLAGSSEDTVSRHRGVKRIILTSHGLSPVTTCFQIR